jgi:hypothetical protein
VRGAHGCRGNAVPLRSPPARGQAPEDLREGRAVVDGEQPGHVLDEQHRRVTVDEDAVDVRPEPPLVVDAGATSGDAGGLAGESRSDEIHSSAPRSAVEGCEIVPDRNRSQARFFHPRHESGCNVGLPLDNAHKASPSGEREVDGVLKSEEAAAECERSELAIRKFGTCSHIHLGSFMTSA